MSDEPSALPVRTRAPPTSYSSDQDPPPAGSVALAKDSLLIETGVEGVYARTQLHETLTARLRAYIARWRPTDAETLAIPPLMSRSVVERSGYVTSFPNLLGCVCALHQEEAHRVASAYQDGPGVNWTDGLRPTEFVLTPAACYPVYPLVGARGRLPRGGLVVNVEADCFRNEGATSPSRLRSFRMHEFVCLGTASDVTAFRELWIARARDMTLELALPSRIEPANDPFFGRIGQVKAVSQLQQALKFELVVPTAADEATACMSFNHHRDHFGVTWNIKDCEGDTAHTGCVAFGLDRLVVAIVATHGLKAARWPASLRAALGLDRDA